MKIKLSVQEEAICRQYLLAKEDNISAAEIYIEYLNEHYDDISKFDIDILGKKYSESCAFYHAFLKKMNISLKDDRYLEIEANSKISQMDLLDEKDYNSDAYIKAIKFPKAVDNNWELATLRYLPFEGFVYDEIVVNNEFYQERTPFGFFDKEFKYLDVIENGETWMSIIPHEINTMKKPIKDAFGDVLVLGLGLGYYAFHIALKDEVEKITIIENDSHVIKLFKQYILPQFPHQEKITIIEDDAFHHLAQGHEYDFIFADIYHNVGDGLGLYLKIKKYEKLYPHTAFEYWIETSLIAMLRRQTLTVFEEQHYGGLKEKDYLKAGNLNDQIINAIYFATKDYPINNSNDLHHLLEDESLKKLAQDLIIK